MDLSDSSAKFWLDIAQMGIQQDSSSRSGQNEPIQSNKVVENPICLFGQFVSVISSDALEDTQARSEFSKFVRDLCAKAPSVAQYLVQEILTYSKDESQPEVEGSKEVETSATTKRSSKRKKQADRSYRLPKSSRTQPDIPRDGAEHSHEGSSVSSQVGDELAPSQSGHDINQNRDSVVTDRPLPKCEKEIQENFAKEVPKEGAAPQEAAQGQSPAHDSTMLSTGSESALQLATDSSDNAKGSAFNKPPVSLNEPTEDSRNALCPPSPSNTEPQETALPEIDGEASDTQALSATSSPNEVELYETTLPGPTPSTPIQLGRGFHSPLSDELTPQTTLFTPISNSEVLSPLTQDDRTASLPDKVEMTLLEGPPSPLSCTGQQQISTTLTQAQEVDQEQQLLLQDSLAILSPSPQKETPTSADMVAKAVCIIYNMSRRQEIPTEVHSRILSTIRRGLGGTPATAAAVGRPDSMWITSSSTTWSASMWISMLEAGHARSKEVTILNMIEWMGASEWYDVELQQAEKAPPATKRGTPRKRLATVVLDKYLKEARDATVMEGSDRLASNDHEDRPSSQDSAGIQQRILDARRKRLNNIFHRGRTLRKLVQMTHLGILFDPDIWNHVKASKENVDKVVALFHADPQKMDLLSILDEQVELLVRTGRPDLSRFFDSLESHSIIGSEEVLSLRTEYGLEREPVPPGCLDTTVDRVVKGISHVLGKHTLSDDDSVMVNGTVELSCGVFNRLRSREWLNCWDIAAALEMADRPMCVKIGLSIPLHKKSVNGDVTPISNPFRRWRKTIDDYRREAKNNSEGLLVYFCPLNLNANHFTLLEINEQTKMIYHYDSMAGHKVIHHKTKSTLVRREIEKEFKYLNFGYTEEPTPQQKDEWSCGLMVIRNATRRMIGLPVGSWDDEIDPDRATKQVVGDCRMFLENDALQPSPLSKKRKRIVEGLQNNVLEPSRSSKRLKQP